MIDTVFAPLGVLLLRWFLAGLLIDHALTQLRALAPQGPTHELVQRGLPPAFGFLIIAAEIIGAACLLIGIYPRMVALLLALLVVSTVSMAWGPRGWLPAGQHSDWRGPALFAVLLLTLAILGDGPATLIASPGFATGI
jgi:putative oxidoreductase